MTVISDLSWDLVESILSRVPITCIGAVRSTCKGWNALSKDWILCNVEARRHQFLGFMVNKYKLCSVRFDLHGILDEEEFVDPSIKESICDSLNQVKVTKVFHCNGLLLCVTKDKDKETEEDRTSLVVWNPYLGQTRWIRNNYHRYDSYAFGYDNKNRQHKILRFLDDYNIDEIYEIYDFSSDSWRVLDITPDWDINCFQQGVSLKGNAYFLAKEKLVVLGVDTPEASDYLLCFDFTREKFGPPLPLPFQHYTYDVGTLSCLRDEKLAALYQSEGMSEVEIWVTTKIEPDAVSWVPFLRTDMETFTGFCFLDYDGASFFIDEEKKVAVVFHVEESEMTTNYDTAYLIGENGYFERVVLGEAVNRPFFVDLGEYCPLVCSYVPSLVHINQFSGGQKLKTNRRKRKIDH